MSNFILLFLYNMLANYFVHTKRNDTITDAQHVSIPGTNVAALKHVSGQGGVRQNFEGGA
jgi:hypothetical protein